MIFATHTQKSLCETNQTPHDKHIPLPGWRHFNDTSFKLTSGLAWEVNRDDWLQWRTKSKDYPSWCQSMFIPSRISCSSRSKKRHRHERKLWDHTQHVASLEVTAEVGKTTSKEMSFGPREIVRWLRKLAALSRDPSLNPSTNVGQLTTVRHSQGIWYLLLASVGTHTCGRYSNTHTDRNGNKYLLKTNFKKNIFLATTNRSNLMPYILIERNC